ncbi:MAG: hypothetical protein J7L75_03985 [Thermoproteales archaeon]|nr:hypothetical protein [Thermoproteales archaeon]
MDRAVAGQRAIQPPTSMAEARVAIREGSVLVAVRLPRLGVERLLGLVASVLETALPDADTPSLLRMAVVLRPLVLHSMVLVGG